MKRLFAFLLTLILVISMVACNKSGEPQNTDTSDEEYSFTAKVLEKYENSLLLEVTDAKNSNILEGTQATIAIKSDYPDCSVGDYITVVFDGVTQETYPLQIPNVYSITLLDK